MAIGPEPEDSLIITAVISGVYAHRKGGVRIDQGGLVHRIKGFNERLALWEFYCDDTFYGDAHTQHVSQSCLTCVACFVRMPWSLQ